MELVRVASTDFLIDLTEPNDDPLAGLRLDTAIEKLTYGLKICPIWRPSSEHMFNILAHQHLGPSTSWPINRTLHARVGHGRGKRRRQRSVRARNYQSRRRRSDG